MGKTHVIAGYFMWREAGPAWQRDMRRFPYLGAVDRRGTHLGYDQNHPENIERHLRWAQAHGVRVLAPIWRGRFDGSWDQRMADNIDVFRGVVKRARFRNMRWCVFLGNVIRNNRPPDLVDFGRRGEPTEAYRNFIDSLTVGLEQRGWLEDPRYFRIDDKPVVVIFRTKDYTGDYQRAVDKVREHHAGRIFLVGMSCQFHRFFEELGEDQIARIEPFDAVTAWSATAGSPPEPKDLAAVAEFLRPRMQSWRDGVSELTVAGTGATRVAFAPAISCQYDKEKMSGNPGPTRFARDRDDFRAMVGAAAENLDPFGVGGGEDALVWVQTFNEWPEGTSCEPTELGPRYPYRFPEYCDHFGFDFLEVLREELHPHLRRSPREALLIGPRDGEVVHTTQPTLQWDEVRANPPVEAYALRVERLRDGVVLFEREVGNATSFTVPFGILDWRSAYAWQVRVRNSWSRPWSHPSLRWTFTVR